MLTPGSIGPPERRASDAERERVAEILREQVTVGRLDFDELSQRLEDAYAARTVGELEILVRDLPVPTTPTEPPPRKAKPERSRLRGLAIRSFFMHAGIYGVVNGFLTGIYVITDFGGYFWPIWPAMGWGVGVGIHAVAAFVGPIPEPKEDKKDMQRPAMSVAAAQRFAAQLPTTKNLVVMFVDIVDSTRLTDVLGDQEWALLLSRHRGMLRNTFTEHDGEQVGTQGDGVLARFLNPLNAARCAIAIQHELDEMRAAVGFAPKVRIGIHSGEAVEDGGDVLGRVVNIASRVTDAADPGEILVTEQVSDAVEGKVPLDDRGIRTLRGVSAPRHLLAVDWTRAEP